MLCPLRRCFECVLTIGVATECFCGNTLATGAADVDISQCSMTCAGSSLQYCGAGDRLSVYQKA